MEKSILEAFESMPHVKKLWIEKSTGNFSIRPKKGWQEVDRPKARVVAVEEPLEEPLEVEPTTDNEEKDSVTKPSGKRGRKAV